MRETEVHYKEPLGNSSQRYKTKEKEQTPSSLASLSGWWLHGFSLMGFVLSLVADLAKQVILSLDLLKP
eukprot:snap_masked-scaffold_33-processed-gene-2.47-mRNA-1 protein AED:1.00 eAED:1.00 QI:0/-1/0/0/-1/1/1/0/68